MRQCSKKVSLFLLTFTYIYSIPFSFLPFGSRVLYSLLGFCWIILLLYKKIKYSTLFISKSLFDIFISLLVLSSFSLLAALLNSTWDLEFISFSLSAILMILASFFLSKCFKIAYTNVTFEILVEYVIIVIWVQNIISLMMFLSPPINDFLSLLLRYEESVMKVVEDTGSYRINGFGTNFFGAGIVNVIGLVLLAYKLICSNPSLKSIWLHSCFFVTISVIGTMMSRTTLIGTIIGIMWIVWNKRLRGKFLFSVLSIILFFVIIPFLFFSPLLLDKIAIALEFGFEMFVNFFNGSGISTNSTDDMLNMYIWPENFSTYLIGDGYFKNPFVPGTFYLNIDIGFLRLLYYFGIGGTISYFYYQYTLVKKVIAMDKGNKNAYLLLFFLVLLFNFKGFSDFSYICLLFCFALGSAQYFTSNKYQI